MLKRVKWKESNGKTQWTEFFLLFNAFTWYYMILKVRDSVLSIPGMKDSAMIISLMIFSSVVVASLFGSILSPMLKRNRFLKLWITCGVVSSLSPVLFVYNHTVVTAVVVFSLLGTTLGFGMPSCLAYFADNTSIEKRGLLVGVIFFIVNISFLPLMIVFDVADLATNSVILSAWRMLGLLLFLMLEKSKEKAHSVHAQIERQSVPFISILRTRSFLLYFLPWSLFGLLESFEHVVIANFLEPALYDLIIAGSSVIMALSVLVSGFFADRIGRKRVLIYGFVALGLGYAMIGLLPHFVFSWYFYAFIDGVAAGTFMVMFVTLLWGDLSESGSRERYYAIGNIPFFVSGIIRIFSMHYVALVPVYASFSLASFFLFLAVLPLMFAPETLPEKVIKKRRLEKYLEGAKKLKEKYKETLKICTTRLCDCIDA